MAKAHTVSHVSNELIRTRFLSLARSKLRLCSANHKPGYWSNLPCDWLSTVWANSEQEKENRPSSWFYPTGAVIAYRNWYQYWGHCCLINDLRSSPQPEGKARVLWWASHVVNETITTKTMYQFLFYHDEAKLMMNEQILSIQMLKFVPKLSLVTAWLHVHILGSCDLIVSPW